MRKWTFLIVILLIILGFLWYVSFGYYSEGKQGGFVLRLSKQGYVFKTYEGELKIGGISEGEGTLSATMWRFSVNSSNQDAIENLELAIKTGRRVSLTYQEKFFKLPWNGETQYFVTEVEVLPVSGMRNSLPGIEPGYQELPQPEPLPLPELESDTSTLL